MDKAETTPAPTLEAAIATNIKHKLATAKISTTQLAKMAAIDYKTLRFRLEAGNGLKLKELSRIATALNTPISSLLPQETLTTKAAE